MKWNIKKIQYLKKYNIIFGQQHISCICYTNSYEYSWTRHTKLTWIRNNLGIYTYSDATNQHASFQVSNELLIQRSN